MTKTEIEEAYGPICQKLMDEANNVCGKNKVFIGPKEYPYGTMIYLSYGDKEYEFNPSGFNYLYVLRQLTDNPVMDAVME
ncbi:MAG: hypothetical protein IKK93_03210 [Campylobacter sp.]|nr:hypothetical protein [Campylobacter sp.]